MRKLILNKRDEQENPKEKNDTLTINQRHMFKILVSFIVVYFG